MAGRSRTGPGRCPRSPAGPRSPRPTAHRQGRARRTLWWSRGPRCREREPVLRVPSGRHGLWLRNRPLPQCPAPCGQIVPTGAAAGFRIGGENLHTGLEQVIPVMDAPGIAGADQEHHRGGIGEVPLCGRRFCQLPGSSWRRAARASMSWARASVTTSAARPSSTDRACLPEPPWDWAICTDRPVFAFQCAAKRGLMA